MRRRLGSALVVAGMASVGWPAAPAVAARPCTIDLAGRTLACQVVLGATAVDCGIRRVEHPPFVTETAGCGVGPVGAGCSNTTYPSSVGPPDGRDCVVVLGPIVCRIHTDETGRPAGAPGCRAGGAAKPRRARARH